MCSRWQRAVAVVTAAFLVSAWGCGGADAPEYAGGKAASVPALRAASAPSNACGWISLDEVVRVLGPVAQPPAAVASIEDLTPSLTGEACVYRLMQKPDSIVLSVLLNTGGQAEVATRVLGKLFARELGTAGQAKSTVPSPPTIQGGWDSEGPVLLPSYADAFGGRQGHLGIVVASRAGEVPMQTLAALAAIVRDRVPDRPFAVPVDPILAQLDLPEEDPQVTPSSPSPCSLLTREEAAAVLGALLTAPYRSNGTTPLATPRGDSCSYFTAGHHALVLRPEWTQGRTLFEMAQGVTGLVGRVVDVGEAEAADTLEGPWDEVTRSWVTGSLFFLKGDRMLEVAYGTSSTDLAGAIRLARAAVARL